MRNLTFLIIIILFLLISCDNKGTETETETETCNTETCLETYKECVNNECVLKDGACEKNGDCIGLNVYCNANHICINPEDPCENINCSDKGNCVLENNLPVCQCDEGYHSSNLDCIENTGLCDNITCDDWKECNQANGLCELKDNMCDRNSDCDSEDYYCAPATHTCVLSENPCEGVTCSNLGRCAIDNGTAVCLCDDGYHADELECKSNNICLDVNCEAWQECNSVTGLCELSTDRCDDNGDCLGDKVCDSNHNCVAPQNPCENIACTNHGDCVIVDNSAVCSCDNGYHAVNLECVVNNLCENVNCDSWEYCDINTGSCNLQNGKCGVNGDCADNQFCNESHICENNPSPCDNINCSDHGNCALNSENLPICACDNGYHPIGLSCVEDVIDLCTNVNCEEWTECNSLNGLCETKSGRCSDNSDCQEGDFCNNLHNCEEAVNPCDGETCSNSGTCVIEFGYPLCQCDEGYQLSEDGLSCIWTGHVWANTFGNSSYSEEVYSITTDNDGDVYIIGSFNRTVDFDPSTEIDELTSTYYSYSYRKDVYISKYKSNGEYEWTRQLYRSYDDFGYSLVVDSDKNIYVSYTTPDYNYLTIHKMTSTGTQVWEKRINGVVYPKDMLLDSNEDYFYISGEFTNTVDFDPSSDIDSHVSVGDKDYFLAKFDTSGNFVYCKTSGGTGTEYVEEMKLDSFDNIYLVGYFSGTTDLEPDSGADTHVANGSTDAYIVKFNSDGSYAWSKTFGGTNSDLTSSIEIDNVGNIYLLGDFYGTVDFDPSADVQERTSKGSKDIFVLKLNYRGLFTWVKTYGGTSAESAGRIMLNDDKLYILGTFNSDITFDETIPQSSHSSIGQTDIFMLSIDNNGEYRFSKSIGGTSYDYISDTIFDNNAIYTTGKFQNTIDFDPENNWSDEYTSSGYNDVFTWKYIPETN